jgi:hypothetical protein
MLRNYKQIIYQIKLSRQQSLKKATTTIQMGKINKDPRNFFGWFLHIGTVFQNFASFLSCDNSISIISIKMEGNGDHASLRKKGFKKGVDQDDARRRRNETTVQIRKDKKEDQIQKRRGVSLSKLHMMKYLF